MAAPAAPSSSRAFSFRAPIATEPERAQFQRRLALSQLVLFILAFGFWAVSVMFIAVLDTFDLAFYLASPTVHVQLATTFLALGGALYLAGGKRSVRVLDAADVVITIGMGVGWATMALMERGAEATAPRMELVPLLAVTFTLVTRAGILPSTAARSAAIGAAAVAPLVPMTYWMHHRSQPLVNCLGAVIYIGMWGSLCVACTSTISHVIYGLRVEVRKAMELGQYVLEDKIGEGGMGVVYRASHKMLRRPCAIKLLTGTTGRAAERFEREVQITARLTHPNTVAVYDYGRTPDGVIYYAMEYLEGITLEELVGEHGKQSVPRVVDILLQVCGALEEAHAKGLVHRDIKPANIMLTERGGLPDVVKVLDFGLVKETKQSDPNLSNVNTIVGTPHYMAPEAITDPSGVDAGVDLYALGATAYFLLTGEHVFAGSTLVEVCGRHLHQAPEAPSARNADVPATLDEIVLGCLAKKRHERPAGASSLAKRLRECDVAEWTREEAHAWWAARGGAPPRTRVAERKPGSPDTIVVALADRGA